MATVVRQVKRYQPSDWYTNICTQSTNAENQRAKSRDVIEESRFLLNETDCQTKWDQYSTDVRLADRVNHLRQWKDTLERILGQLDQEISDLSEAKEAVDNFLEKLNVRTDAVVECLTLREQRRSLEVVVDEPETQLHKEVEAIDGLKKTMLQKYSDAFEQLCLLQEARQQLSENLQDKNTALGIDIDQYNLSDVSPSIGFKHDALRVPKGCVTCQQWDYFSRHGLEKAEAELKQSSKLREQINQKIQHASNELDAQKQAIEFAFRKRIHDTQRAKDEMEWQKKNIENDIAELENDIRNMEESLRNKSRTTMKAETRLENRTYRPNVELCCDAVHFSLVDEVKQLYATSRALQEKLKMAQLALDGLQKSSNRLKDDIALKTQTLFNDNQCMGILLKLNPPAKKDTENNLILTGIERIKST